MHVPKFNSKIIRTLACVWGIAIGFMWAPIAPANASNALRYMPEDALGFVLVNNLESLDAKVSRFTLIFDLPVPAPLTFIKFATGLDEGIRKKGDLLVALLPASEPTSEPQPMVLLPIEDYAKFAASIHGDASGEICRASIAGEDVLVAKFGEYALLMNVEHRETLQFLLSLQQAPVADLKPLDPWIEKNDVVVALLPEGLDALLKLGNQAISKQPPQFNGMNVETLQWGMDSLAKEVKLVAVAVSLDDQTNLRISKRVLLKEGGKLFAIAPLLDAKSSPLTGYTDQPFVVAGGGPIPESWSKALSAMTLQMMKSMPKAYGLESIDEEQWTKLEHAYSSMMKGLRSSSMILLPGEKGDPLFSNLFGVAKTTGADEYLDSFLKATESWNEVMELSTSDLAFRYDVTTKTIADHKACELLVDMAAIARDPNVPAFNWMLEAMFGEDGKLRQLLVVADKHSIVYGMSKEEDLLSVIDRLKEGETGLRDSPLVQTALKLSPTEAPWRVLVSPQGCVLWAKRFAESFLVHLTGQLPEIPDFDACPPIALTANLREGQIETDFVCPVETLKALATYIKKCKALFP